jgi:hypothetical protein
VTGFDQIAGLWEDGQRRVREAEPVERRIYEQVVDQIVLELRRRLGGRFTADELTDYYLQQGTDWCYEIAYRTAPSHPEAWDMGIVAGAAFARFVRSATDYGGGLRREEQDPPPDIYDV